jgi:transposase-like protein
MHTPPFCPHAGCRYHHKAPEDRRWYHLAGSYETKAFGTVTRFRCLACGGGFSEQTFRLDYFIKRPLSYDEIFSRVVTGSGIRSIARRLSVSHQTILNRLTRLARQALALHAELIATLTLSEDLAADGFESFVGSQYEPDNTHILVGSRSQFIYTFDYAHLKRKGRMTDEQKIERERREADKVHDRISIPTSFARVVETMEELLLARVKGATVLYTDEKREYVQVLLESVLLREIMRRGLFAHERVSSKKARTPTNKLFPVNYTDRQIRKDNANHVRETVQFSRSVPNALERMAVYQMYQNYRKPFRVARKEKRKYLHAEVAGIERALIEEKLEDIYERRKFFTHLELTWSQILVWFRMVGNVDRLTGSFRPAYIWM